MSSAQNIDSAREIASQLAGSLDLLASLHATVAAHDAHGRDTEALAATFALLHATASRLADLLA